MASNQQSKRKGGKQATVWPLYLVLVLLIAAYALYNNIILGVVTLLFVIGLLILEFAASVKTDGAKRAVLDTLLAVAAVFIVWIVFMFLLQTSSPINVVASCSMLPVLHRGDLVVLHGISNMTYFLESKKIPIVQLNKSAFNAFESNISNEFVAFFAYSPSNRSTIGTLINSTSSGYGVNLYSTQCLNTYSFLGQPRNYYKCYLPSQQMNLIKYNYSLANVTVGGQQAKIVETSSINLDGTSISQNYSNPIIVYRTTKQDSFSGDIIHRVYAAIRVGDSYYLLTRGDNNPALDLQFANYPINQSDVVGYVVAEVPALGYLKLIISGQLGQVPGCNQQISRS